MRLQGTGWATLGTEISTFVLPLTRCSIFLEKKKKKATQKPWAAGDRELPAWPRYRSPMEVISVALSGPRGTSWSLPHCRHTPKVWLSSRTHTHAVKHLLSWLNTKTQVIESTRGGRAQNTEWHHHNFLFLLVAMSPRICMLPAIGGWWLSRAGSVFAPQPQQNLIPALAGKPDQTWQWCILHAGLVDMWTKVPPLCMAKAS